MSETLQWTVDADEIEKWFPFETRRRQAASRIGALRGAFFGFVLSAGMIVVCHSLVPEISLVLLRIAAFVSIIPLMILILPIRVFRLRRIDFLLAEKELRVGRSKRTWSQITAVHWAQRPSHSQPGVVWLLGHNLPPAALIWPRSLPVDTALTRNLPPSVGMGTTS
jgi:hypothetical protein